MKEPHAAAVRMASSRTARLPGLEIRVANKPAACTACWHPEAPGPVWVPLTSAMDRPRCWRGSPGALSSAKAEPQAEAV
jgi:hypothetical protein